MTEPAQTWKQKYGPRILQVATVVLTAVLSALGTYFAGPEKVVNKTVTVERLVPDFDEFDGAAPPVSTHGWVNDPDAAWEAAQTLPVQVFGDTPAGQATDLPRSTYLWQAHQKLLGSLPPEKDQNPTGSCVGFGTTTAVERTLAADILARGGDKSEFSYFSEEVTYAGSRVEVNGGTCPIRPTRADPSGDGSSGGWAAKFVTQWGMVPKAKYGDLDLTAYSAARARSWNYSGVPDHLEPTARKHPVKSAARITSWADAKKALASGYGIQVASSQGFARQRDANGVARACGNWAHSMCLDGYHSDADGREYGHVENSWSKVGYHTGPVGWGSPTGAGFWADADVVNRMLREGDSYAFSGATGFPARKLNFLIRAVPARPRDPFAFALFAQEDRFSW